MNSAFFMHDGCVRLQRTGRGVALSALALLTCGGVAMAGFTPPNPYRFTYAVGEDNRVYSRDVDDPSGLYKPTPGFQLPAGEQIVGMDFSSISVRWYFLSKSGKVFSAGWNSASSGFEVVQLGDAAPVTLQGNSFGFDLDGNERLYITTAAGQSMMFDTTTNWWSSRPGLVKNGVDASIGGLAVFDGRGANRFVGIDTSDGWVVRCDIEQGGVSNIAQAGYFDLSGFNPIPFSGSSVAGFDAVLFANLYQPMPQATGWSGGVALNEPGQTNTRLYPMFWDRLSTEPQFLPPVSMIADGNPSLRFTAIAASPTPGTTALFGTVLLIGVRRQRVVT